MPTPANGDPVQIARSFLGAPYKFGGNDCNGIDCSGLVTKAYPNLPRTARDQYGATQRIGPQDLQAGDLVFLQGTQRGRLAAGQASHVGIYDGKGGVIASPHTGGRVTTLPLSQWQSKNFLGFGRVSSMPRNSQIGPTSVPGRAQSSLQIPPNPSQGGDIYSYIAGLVAGRPQMAPPHLYDPFSPTTVDNPDYNPTPTDALSGALGSGPLDLATTFAPRPQSGPARPYDDRQTIEQPSLQQQANQAQISAQQQAPDPMAAAVAEQKARAGLHKSLADLMAANPQADLQLPDRLPFPDRQQAPIPTRPAPQYDPLSGGLATLAGFVDPQHAGQYGQAPLQAGLGVAAQAYGDSLQHYQLQSQQLAQQYEHDLEARNDLAHYLHEKAGVGFDNANRRRQMELAIGENRAQADSAGGLADSLSGIGAATKQAGATQLQGDLLNHQIGQQLASNAAQINYAQAGDKRDADLYKTLLQTMGRGYSSDNHLKGVQDANNARREIGAGHDDAHLKGIGMQQDGQDKRNAANNDTKRFVSNKAYQATMAKLNALYEKGQTLQANPVVPANLRSRMSQFSQMAQQTHKQVVQLKAQGQQVPQDLLDDLGNYTSGYESAFRDATDYVNTHQRQPTTGATPGNGTRATPATPAQPSGPRLHSHISGGPILDPSGRPLQ